MAESKRDYGDSKYADDGKDDEKIYYDDKSAKDSGNEYKQELPRVDVTAISIRPAGMADLESPIHLNIKFELDRDVIAGFWKVQMLVDSSNARIIKVLGETDVEDYPDGESEMDFSARSVDISGIAPSTLTNSGLLMAIFMADGEEVISVNMVVNVTKQDGRIMREILNPLD